MVNAPRTELRALTSVRGIAAWMVVLYHTRLSMEGVPPALLAVLAKGYLAVDFFFLLSGFVMWMTWGPRFAEHGFAEAPRFLRKRIARIWPLHIVVLAGAVALALLLAVAGHHDAAAFPFDELPLHILLVQNWGFTRALSWNDPAWSISAELGAYLLFPLLAASIDWRRAPTWLVLGAAAALLVGLHLIFVRTGAATLGTDIPRHGLIRCVIEFAAGTTIGALWLRWRDRWKLPAALAALLAATGGAATAAGLVPETLGVPASFAAALLALALTSGRRGNPLDARLPHYLGEISYATYLSHFLLWFAVKLAFVPDTHVAPPWLIAAYLLLVLACSAALYHLVELPAQRAINGWLPRPRLSLGR